MRASAIAAIVICVLAALAASAGAGDVLAQISQRNPRLANRYYGRLFVFPANVRDYSERNFYGYSFRQELRSGGVRELEIARVHSPGAYLIATDLFANGRFSTMSHTVLMVFPRRSAGPDFYALSEDAATGNLRIRAPDGSWLMIDGRSEAVLPTADFQLTPQGATGAPPGLRHRGVHLAISAVGRSPFLRGTPVTAEDSAGNSCRLVTEDVFRYGGGPESDVFRFDTDADLFRLLAVRCPTLDLPRDRFQQTETRSTIQPAAFSTTEPPSAPMQPAEAKATSPETAVPQAPQPTTATSSTGALRSFWRFLSEPEPQNGQSTTASKPKRGMTGPLSGRLW